MHIKTNTSNSMQDINKETKRERERAITNTRDLFRGSSTLALHPRLRHTKDFHYNRSQWITRCRNTYNEFPLELLGLSLVRTHRKPTSSPRPHLKHGVHTRTRNYQVHTMTRNNANTHVRLLKVQEMISW